MPCGWLSATQRSGFEHVLLNCMGLVVVEEMLCEKLIDVEH